VASLELDAEGVAGVTVKFSQFMDDLLLALVRYGESDRNDFIDPRDAAERAGLKYQPGHVREAVRTLEGRGLVRAHYTMGGGPDGGMGLTVTGEGLTRAEGIEDERKQQNASGQVPASDRVVTVNHNAPDYRATSDTLVQTIAAVKGDNEYANEDPEDREQRIAELEASQRLLQAERVDLDWVERLFLRTLRYLANKFADNAIGVVVGLLISHVLALFGMT